MLDVKLQLYQQCLETVNRRITAAEGAIDDLQNDANEETKSSAGDKYETGRAMMQLEMEKYAQQLAEARRAKQVLEKLDVSSLHSETHPGCIVRTDQGNFFLSISAGPIIVGDDTFVTISSVSPLGAKLLHTREGDEFSLNNRQYKVLGVY